MCQKALLLSRQLRNVYYTCAILYVLWDMRNRYVFVSWALGLNPKWDMLLCPRLTCIKDRKEIDIKIRDKTIDKKECFFYGFYWRRQHDFFWAGAYKQKSHAYTSVRQSIVSQIGVHETTFNMMWLQNMLTSFNIFL